MRARGLYVLIPFLATPAAAQAPRPAAGPRPLVEMPAPRFGVSESIRTPAPANATAVRQSGAAFPIEFAGAMAGSLIGLGAGLLIASPNECDSEDIACILERLGWVGLMSVVAAPAGTMLVGDWADTRPSLLGAAIGSVAGAVAGVGVLKLTEEIDDDPFPALFALIAYSGTHGLLTAAGSRIGAAFR